MGDDVSVSRVRVLTVAYKNRTQMHCQNPWVIVDFEANFGLRHVLGLGYQGKGCCGHVSLVSSLQRHLTHTVGAHPRKGTRQGRTDGENVLHYTCHWALKTVPSFDTWI